MKSLQDHLADDFRIHLQQISEDFQRLESRIRALARENADLKSNGKSTLTPVAAGKVVFGGDHLQDSLENQFEEAFGSNYQDKLPTIDTTQISTVAKYQHSKTVSRSNSGDLLGKRIIVVGWKFLEKIDIFCRLRNPFVLPTKTIAEHKCLRTYAENLYKRHDQEIYNWKWTYRGHCVSWLLKLDCNLPETNMAPENRWLKDYFPLGMA